MKKFREITFLVLAIPVMSLLIHNIIPHEHHLSCPDHDETTSQSVQLSGVQHCCGHHAADTHKPVKKANCILTSLPPVFYSVQVFLISRTYHVDESTAWIFGQFITSFQDKIFQQEYYRNLRLRAPPIVLV
ncbi:MAG: hypothetical protein GX437_06765 [Sphingobacteriales bacterium]|nr:hypothetical protein [Sphingobacteriales bacterium]